MEKANLELLREMYEKSEFKDIIHNVSGVYIPLDYNWKNIGIAMSGGIDSTMLCFLLCSLIEKHKLDITVHVTAHVRVWKLRPWQKDVSLNVYNWMVNHFPNIKFKRHPGFIPPDLEWKNNGPTLVLNEYGEEEYGDVLVMRSFAEYVGFHEKFDAFYNATTMNPNDPNITLALDVRNLTSHDIVEHFDYAIKYYRMGDHIVTAHPFRFVQKDWIVGRYQEFGIMDLFDMTRSCEGDKVEYPEVFGNLDYKTYTPGMEVPTCGKCFWCQEREWGIKNAY
jgi:hypothetical protein